LLALFEFIPLEIYFKDGSFHSGTFKPGSFSLLLSVDSEKE